MENSLKHSCLTGAFIAETQLYVPPWIARSKPGNDAFIGLGIQEAAELTAAAWVLELA